MTMTMVLAAARSGPAAARPAIAAPHRGGPDLGAGRRPRRGTSPSRVAVQRCGDTPCSCSPQQRQAHAQAHAQPQVQTPTQAGAEAQTPTQAGAETQVQTQSGAPGADGAGGAVTAAGIDAVRGAGTPLDPALRHQLEPVAGTSLAGVRIHTGPAAGALALGLRAQAFTAGRDIFFGPGAYAPGTAAGRHLLAHEAVHVAQQAAGPVAGTVQGDLSVSDPGDAFEQEAERIAQQASSGSAAASPGRPATASPARHPGAVGQGATVSLQRQESKPLIPIPIFDQLDPGVSVPNVPGVPGFLRGQTAHLSDVKKALDLLRGAGRKNPPDCKPFIGFERAGMGEFAGKCCYGLMRSKENCCDYQDIALAENRCCTGPLEVIIDNHCVKLSLAPITPSLPAPPPTTPTTPVPPVPPNQAVPVAVSVPFKLDKPAAGATGSAALQASMESGGPAALASVIATLKANPDLRVQLVGRASPEGTDDYNLALGARRASLVANAVVEGGAQAAQVDDPPANDLNTACQPVRKGVATCGRSGSTGPADRQVLARFTSSTAQP
jgi:hypothetical protein